MLFQAAQVNNFSRRRNLSLDYWKWLRDDLRQARFDLIAILVPSKYRVYRPFLVDQSPPSQPAADDLGRLEGALRAMGIPVLNLTPANSDEEIGRASCRERV